jgi:hypothetical protein
VDGWQIQCCGTPFHVGDAVEWTLTGNKDVEWLEDVVGPETAHMIDFSEEHHGGLPADAPVTQGRVARIHAARSRFSATPGADPKMLHPVPGSGELVEVASADGWEPESSGLTFNGYVVDLDSYSSSIN